MTNIKQGLQKEEEMLKKIVLTLSFVLIGSGAALAAGAHESLECTGCHNIHYAKGPIIFEVAPNAKAGAPENSVAALCLGCHSDSDKGGMGILPISQHTTHPYGKAVNKKVASVPEGLLRNGVMDCVSCHDPHPSNPNYKYLRVDTKGGKDMQAFCDLCHPAKVDVSVSRGGLKVFDSMDEELGAVNKSVSDSSVSRVEKSAAPAGTAPEAKPKVKVKKKKAE